ncbi:MAG: hypothetical protein RJB38_1757 [Pseudomonadota bacterium]|jgi:hypothetical protein
MWLKVKKLPNGKPTTVQRQPLLKFPHLRRVVASIEIEGQSFDARVLLNDIAPGGLRLFSSKPVAPGESVFLTLYEPRILEVKARVIERSAPMRQGHILSAAHFPHRMAVRFEFSSDDEERAVAEFVEDLWVLHGIRATAPITGLEFTEAFV